MRLKRVPILLTALASVLFLTNACYHTAKTTVATTPPAPPPAVVGTPLPSLKAPSGKTYSRTQIDPSDDKEVVDIPPVPAGAAPNLDTFHGTSRKAAKLSIVTGTPKSFSDVGTLLDSLVPDAKMRAMSISKGADSDRVPLRRESRER